MRAKREAKGMRDKIGPDASPMRSRSVDKEAPPAPDVSKAMAAVYFSYEAEPAGGGPAVESTNASAAG